MLTRRVSGSDGYSFIEMLTAVIVFGILLSIAIMSMAPSLRQAKVRNAASVLAGDLHYAQALAVQHRRPIAIIVVEATKQYIIRERDNPTIVYRTRSLGPDSDFALDQFTASPTTSVEVFPNGVARQTTTFTIGLDTYEREVRISKAGQIRIIN